MGVPNYIFNPSDTYKRAITVVVVKKDHTIPYQETFFSEKAARERVSFLQCWATCDVASIRAHEPYSDDRRFCIRRDGAWWVCKQKWTDIPRSKRKRAMRGGWWV